MLYNIRRFHYFDGIQIRLYARPVYLGKKKDNIFDDFSEDDFSGEADNDASPDEDSQDSTRSLMVSMNRSKQMIYGIARANEWQYFLTLTFDRNLIDSSDYGLVVKKSQKWLDNIRQKYCPDMKYLIVPELHVDGEHWHLHGLLSNCSNLTLTDSGHKSKSGLTIYNLQNWRYGFSTVTEVTHNHKVSAYISKYITKELCNSTKNRQRYWASNNCIRPMEVCEHDFINVDVEDLIRMYSVDCKHISERSSKDGSQRIIYIEVDNET